MSSSAEILKEAAKKYEELFELMETISVTDAKELEEERNFLSIEGKNLTAAHRNLCRIISSFEQKDLLDKEDHVAMIKDCQLKTEKDEYLPEFKTGVVNKESTGEEGKEGVPVLKKPRILSNMKINENLAHVKTCVEQKYPIVEEDLALSEPAGVKRKYPFVEYRHPECFDFLFREYLPLPPPIRFLPIFSEPDTINSKKRKRSPERSSIPERQAWPSWEDDWNSAMQELRDYEKVYLDNFEQFKREDNYPHYEPEEEEDYYDEFKGFGDDPFGCEPNKEEEEEEERKREEEWKNISLKYLF